MNQNFHAYGLIALHITNTALIRNDVLPKNVQSLEKIFNSLVRLQSHVFDMDPAMRRKAVFATNEVLNLERNVIESFYTYSLSLLNQFIQNQKQISEVSVSNNFEELVNKMYIATFIEMMFIFYGPCTLQREFLNKLLDHFTYLPGEPPQNITTSDLVIYSNFVNQMCITIFDQEPFNRIQVINNNYLNTNTLQGVLYGGTITNSVIQNVGILHSNANIQNSIFSNNTVSGILQNNATIQNGILLNNTLSGLIKSSATIESGTLSNNTIIGTLQNSGNIVGGTLSSSTLTGIYTRDFTVDGDLKVENGQLFINGVQYNQTSDYRLKENIKLFENSLQEVCKLSVYEFNFKGEDTVKKGFLAHELAQVVPYAVFGEKDGVDSKGNPKYQVLDKVELIPFLVQSIKELKKEVDDLRQIVDAQRKSV
jgi:hypothetical protein